jgi:hypothetical protein
MLDSDQAGWTTNGAVTMFMSVSAFSIVPLIPPEPIYRESTRVSLDIATRFLELETLEDGWLDGQGKALSREGLDWLAGMIRKLYPDTLPPPFVYAMPDGRLQLEWSFKCREISLEVDLATKAGEWHSLDVDTGTEEAKTFDLATEPDWSRVVDRLRTAAGATW